MEGWIKIYPKMTEWRWYTDTYAKCIFLHLLLTANFKDKPFLNTVIKRGQVLTSVRHLSEDLGIPERTVRRKLDNLKSTGELVTESTNKWTIITICNYESYQGSEKTDDRTNDRADDQTNDQQHKNNRKIDIYPPTISNDIVSPPQGGTQIEERQRNFYDSLRPFIDRFGKQLLRDFYDYWSEPDRAAKPKMRWEKEKTWSLERRLERWQRNNEVGFDQRPRNKTSKLDQYKQAAMELGLIQEDNESGQINSVDEQ